MSDIPDNMEIKFTNAANYLRKNVADLSSDQLLFFYGRFKQANDGRCNTPRPSFFDFQGKQKWDSWSNLGDMPRDTAKKEYVLALSEIFPVWESKADDSPAKSACGAGFGVAVSTLARAAPDTDDGAPDTVFDWCKLGDVHKVKQLLSAVDINDRDMEGLSLLHWACDRGLADMARLLLDSGADLNGPDGEMQTPLHYAASCGHAEVVRLLVSRGADLAARDEDGLTPRQTADCPDIAALLQR